MTRIALGFKKTEFSMSEKHWWRRRPMWASNACEHQIEVTNIEVKLSTDAYSMANWVGQIMCRQSVTPQVARDKLVALGTCMGKLTHTGKFRLTIGALDLLSQHAKYKVRPDVKLTCEVNLFTNHVMVSVPQRHPFLWWLLNIFSLQTEPYISVLACDDLKVWGLGWPSFTTLHHALL